MDRWIEFFSRGIFPKKREKRTRRPSQNGEYPAAALVAVQVGVLEIEDFRCLFPFLPILYVGGMSVQDMREEVLMCSQKGNHLPAEALSVGLRAGRS